MRRVIFATLCAALMAVPGTASAATNGQLVAVGSALLTFNPDGSGMLTRWNPGSGHSLDSPRWSPDGNAIAVVDSGRITVFDLASGQAHALTSGPADKVPTWSPDGQRIAFARFNTVLTMRRDGSDVQTLLELDPSEIVDALAWAPDGSALALVSGTTLLRVDLDNDDVDVLVPQDVSRGLSWSPDAMQLAYTLNSQVRLLPGGIVGDGSNSEPAFSPDGRRLVFAHFTGPFQPSLATMTIGDPASQATIPQVWRGQLSDPDWQPCVAGVTVSCVSPGWRCADAALTVVAGTIATTDALCGATRTDVIDAPTSPGWRVGTSAGRITVRTPSTFAGNALIHYRAVRGNEISEIATLTVTATPKPAAPHLSVIGKPKLDRRGRVLLRATCDRACSVSLRAIIRLNTQRVLKGRIVKATGTTFRLRLQRAKLPRHRRIVAARIAGTLKGADGLRRNFTLSLIP